MGSGYLTDEELELCQTIEQPLTTPCDVKMSDSTTNNDRINNMSITKATKEPEENRGRKDEPASQGWTIEKCDMHIQEMEHLISTGGIQKDIGRALMGIPLAAKRRLQGAE